MPRLSKIGAAALAAFGWTSGDSAVTASYLQVAGGGGGGKRRGGGGGAGGLLSGTTSLNPATTYTVTVGAGGAGSTSDSANGIQGSNSQFGTLTASVGGGYGSSNNSGSNGGTGGSGGGSNGSAGAGSGPGTGGTATSGQGNAGGYGYGNSGTDGAGGGGGGAGSAGGDDASGASTGGAGGAGVASSISGTSTYYAGGGGGGSNGGTAGVGGAGGGANGSIGGGGTASSGTANFGGGGGGGGGNIAITPDNGGNGGSGVVIISYPSPQKFGGGIVTTSGSNTIHTFQTSGTLSPLSTLSASYLIVAGGAGAGGSTTALNGGAGGGGAGGLLSGSGTTIDTNSTYVVTVGAGGTGGTGGVNGSNGSNSLFSIVSTTAVGGGFGSIQQSSSTGNGGSGGGTGWAATGPGTGTSGQGNNGGGASTGGAVGGGGGGGSTSVGQTYNGGSNRGGNGGTGTTSSISGTSTGYAGGGGGGSASGGTGGTGTEGGGSGVATGSGNSGTTNTGGGGGGAGSTNGASGGSGGSGIVIISYAGSTQLMAGGTVTISGGNVIHTFTSSGYLTPLKLVNNSLRFRASASAYLTRTNTVASNRQTYTYSAWVKRGTLGTGQTLVVGGRSGTSNTTFSSLYFRTDNAIDFGGYTSNFISTSSYAVYRDPAAWYHVVLAVDTTQATTANRIKLYINGVLQTVSQGAGYPAQNALTGINTADIMNIGGNDPAGGYYDGEQTEVNFIDGQQLTPNSFGTFNSYGVWQPITYGGSYGTNGFYLPFTNKTSTTTLGYDFSPAGNNWTTNNISLTAGSTYDSMTDVPTLTSATVANYCVFNPLDRGSTNFTLSNGNLTISGASASSATRATMAVSSGKWYWEATPTAIGNGLGVGFAGDSSRFNPATWNAGTYVIYQSDGNKHINGSASAYGATYTTSDVIGVALDMDAGTITFYKNNTSQGTASTGLTGVYLPVFSQTSGATTGTINANFGAGSGFTYTPPTGFVALNTYNLPTSTIVKGNTVMDATTYTGNGSTQSITNAGTTKPDLVWVKSRSSATYNELYDSVRGVSKRLFSNDTAAEADFSPYGVTAFNSNGFTVNDVTSSGYGVNESGVSYIGWNWKAGGTAVSNTSGTITSSVSANTTSGFSVVTYTGTGSAATVGHGLGVAPAMIIVKVRSRGADDWGVYHQSLGNTGFLALNTTAANTSSSVFWNSTSPTSSVFSLGTNSNVNPSGQTLVAYCWTPIAGYSAMGSYTGNGSTDGVFVYLGFRPRFLMIKSSGSAQPWIIFDTSRNVFNVTNNVLQPNSSSAESTGNGELDVLSNGFKIRSVDNAMNTSSGTYIYMAFAETPLKFSNAR